MKVNKSNIHLCLIFIPGICLLSGCEPKSVCITELQKVNTKTISITGPQHLKVGEQATITVGMRNNLLTCVKEGHAAFVNIGFDSLLVNSQLTFTNDPISPKCDCKTDSIVYTLIYFTPLNTGTYYFLTEKKDSSISTVVPGNMLDFTITVD